MRKRNGQQRNITTPRACSICRHPAALDIEKAWISGKWSVKALAEKYGVSPSSLTRHIKNHLSQELALAAQRKRFKEKDKILDRLVERVRQVELMLDACHEYLIDPRDPTKYFLGPQADDIEVIYNEGSWEFGKDGEEHLVVHRKVARLQELLSKAGVEVDHSRWKIADPRKLILEAAGRLEGLLLTVSRLEGYIQPPQRTTEVNIQVNQMLVQILPNVMEVLNRHPDVKAEVLRALDQARMITGNAGSDQTT